MKIIAPKLPAGLENVQKLVELLQQETALLGIAVTSGDFQGKTLKSLTLSESLVQKSNFESAKLENAQLLDVRFDACSFPGSKFPKLSAHRVSWHDSRMSGVQMYEAVLENVMFSDCKLDMANFRFTKFKDVVFRDCVLEKADFANAVFESVAFEKCDLGEADFSNTKAKNLDLRTSSVVTIQGITSLEGAVISKVQLIGLAPQFAHEIGMIVKDD